MGGREGPGLPRRRTRLDDVDAVGAQLGRRLGVARGVERELRAAEVGRDHHRRRLRSSDSAAARMSGRWSAGSNQEATEMARPTAQAATANAAAGRAGAADSSAPRPDREHGQHGDRVAGDEVVGAEQVQHERHRHGGRGDPQRHPRRADRPPAAAAQHEGQRDRRPPPAAARARGWRPGRSRRPRTGSPSAGRGWRGRSGRSSPCGRRPGRAPAAAARAAASTTASDRRQHRPGPPRPPRAATRPRRAPGTREVVRGQRQGRATAQSASGPAPGRRSARAKSQNDSAPRRVSSE